MEASSSHSPDVSYDVFISFRGEDTRNFCRFLCEDLKKSNIISFFDENTILMGDNLSEKLVKAIEESRCSIVILSEDYASSKWCLRELAQIIDCMTGTRKIFPVFYRVHPSNVRHLDGSFKGSFDGHEEEGKHLNEIQQWKTAMTELGNIAGRVVTKDSHEPKVIKEIVKEVHDLLYTRSEKTDKNSSVDISPDQLEEMEKLLDLDSKDVRFVGIVGMGGIGKTTIATHVYHEFKHLFTGSCLLHVISDCSLVSLQQELLSEILQTKDLKISDEDHGAKTIKYHLCRRKVLIVLDGVKEKWQLEKLAGSADWFGPQSRVIITTRYRDILRQPNYKDSMRKYNVKFLDNEKAISLFCKHAFGYVTPDGKFMQLVRRIVDTIKGHPEALINIGSYLFGRSIDIWEEELKSLTSLHNERLFNILRMSLDGLGTTSKQAFLDLACFLNGRKKDKVIEIFESFGYKPHSEIQLLCDRCLIEVDEDKIHMHSLVQAMGQKIEREASKRSRFWVKNDVLDVFDKQHGVEHIQGIVLEMGEKQESISLEAKHFKDMRSLRILELCNVQLCKDITHLSKQLRLLKWHGYPSKCLPSQFESRYLFELLLPIAKTTQLWKGQKRFEKLKVIDASNSKNLRVTPDLTEVPNLERLILRNCTRLDKLHSSIKHLNRLVILDIRCCVKLKNYSENINCRVQILS